MSYFLGGENSSGREEGGEGGRKSSTEVIGKNGGRYGSEKIFQLTTSPKREREYSARVGETSESKGGRIKN